MHLMSVMLSLIRSRPICKFRAFLPLHCLVTSRQNYKVQPKTIGCLDSINRYVNLSQHIGNGLPFTIKVGSLRNYCTVQMEVGCWKCQHILEKHPAFFCTHCKVVQPPDEMTSYFQLLDCNHSFTVDTQQLQKRYLQLQRSLHPDNFTQKTKEEQEYSEHQSALLNKAYETLLKPLSRGLYMLELEGVLVEEGTDSGAEPLFLMELMELNEALDETRLPEEAKKIGQNAKVKMADLTVQIDDALRKGEHQAAKTLLAKMKYFANIEEKVKDKLSELM